MHETGLLFAAVAQLTDATGHRPLSRVELAIGPGVDPGAAAQAWQRAAKGGPAEHATVAWTSATDILACLGCGEEYSGDRLTRCPVCGADGLVTSPAPEIEIAGWTVLPGKQSVT